MGNVVPQATLHVTHAEEGERTAPPGAVWGLGSLVVNVFFPRIWFLQCGEGPHLLPDREMSWPGFICPPEQLRGSPGG